MVEQSLKNNLLIEVPDFSHNTNPYRKIYSVYLSLMKETRKTSTRKRLELETLGSRLIVLKIFPQTLMQNNQLLTKIQIELKDNSNTVEMRHRLLLESRTSVCNHAAKIYIEKLEESPSFDSRRRVATYSLGNGNRA